MTEKKPIVSVIDDDPVIVDAITWLLNTVHLLVETYPSADAFLAQYRDYQYGCILLDIRMPGMSGLQLQEELNKRGNRLPIILLSGHGDVPMAVRAMKAGAFDFITKPFNDQVLLEQIQNAILQSQFSQNQPDTQLLTQRLIGLTPREHEVMEHVVNGKMNKVIAYEMNISEKTVEKHRSSVMQKMQVKSLAELIRVYVQLNPEY